MEQNNQVSLNETPLQQEIVVRVEVSKGKRNISTKLSQEKSERLKNAWIAVKQHSMSLYAAGRKYDVPISTLWDWCQRDDIIDKTPVVGRPCYLGTALEDKLKDWVFEAAQTGKQNSCENLADAEHNHSILISCLIRFSNQLSTVDV